MLEMDDTPVYHFFHNNLKSLAWAVVIAASLCLLACGALYRRLGASWRGLGLWFSMVIGGALAGGDAIWVLSDQANFELTKPSSIFDWVRILSFPAAGCFFLTLVGGRNWETDELIRRDVPWRYLVTFVLGASSAFVYALADHVVFWQPAWNGGHHYELYFEPDELISANLVLFSTSLFFASLIGLVAVICKAAFRATCVRESGRIGRCSPVQGRQALAVTVFWTVFLSWPWLLELWPEIESEEAWILPVATTCFFFAVLVGPVGMASNLIARDELKKRQTPGPDDGASERTFLTATLFPLYPLLRWIPAKTSHRRRKLLLAVGVSSAMLMVWLAHAADELFSLEDWRGGAKKSQLPHLQTYCSVLLAFGAYLGWRRYMRWRGYGSDGVNQPNGLRKERLWGRRLIWTLFALMLFGGTWPFFGWGNVSENTFARTAEFSGRHRLELLTLHWLFDGDGDGYSSVLHGADDDDDDASLLAGGMSSVGPTFAAEDFFRVDNPYALQSFPSVVLLFLEGVTPDAVSAYGKRQLRAGRATTPHLDELAADGALFSNARVLCPSTWDTWYGTLSGRMLRVTKMSMRWKFGDRYNRLNNFRKIIAMGGIQRWCNPDAAEFVKLFLTNDDRRTNWQPEFDATLSEEDRKAEITRGDKRLNRMIDFIDDLQYGERFFLCEHLSDTHFPWSRTSTERAKKLGFPEGLGFAEEGGKTDQQKQYFQTITRVDGQIGTLMRRLKEREIYDHACVIVIGDQGCQWYEHEHGYNTNHLYEPCIRIPFIVKLPKGKGRSLLRIDAPVIPQDVLPTLCELGGITHEPNEALGVLYGKSFLPLLDGREEAEDSERRWNRDFLLISRHDKVGVLHRSRYKLIFDRPVGTYRMFDLKNDPAEMVNLADKEKAGMMKTLTMLLRSMAWRHRPFLAGIRWPEEASSEKQTIP